MVSLMHFNFRKVLLLYLVLFLLTSSILLVSTETDPRGHKSEQFLGKRRLLALEEDEAIIQPKKKSSSFSVKNQTKLLKPNQSTKNQTKLIKSNLSTKNQTKLIKATNSTKASTPSSLFKSVLKKLNSTSQLKKLNSTSQLKKLNSTSQLKKLNSTSQLKKLNSTSQLKKLNLTLKPTNPTKSSSSSSKKASDLLKISSPKNKATKPTSTKQTQSLVEKKLIDPKSSKSKKDQTPQKKPKQENTQKQKQHQKQPSWIDQDDEDDLVSEFRDLPLKFQQTLLPDLERISTTSKAYITKYNKEMTKQFKPIVGHKHAPTIATIVSCAFILIPLVLVSLIVNRIKTYFSLQKLLIFIQVYLSIYFSILCLTSLVTGLEPLRFFYATSPSSYVCLQVLQTLGYVLYLLLLLMYLVLVFSTECGLGSKLLGLGQTFVGFAVGLHYYVAVFHRVVLHQPPKTNWKVHLIYATCFLVICLCGQAERRKKAYTQEGGDEGKQN
ncbi:hypothetical protein SLE2022_366470 [Rubroshorea leprosula]